jgi:hypothetical protein
VFADDKNGVNMGCTETIYYLQDGPTLRVPFVSTVLQKEPFEFSTCGADTRTLILIDDSAVPNAHSMVYYDSSSQELVLVGSQTPPLGTYEVKVTAVIKAKARYLIASFVFDLSVVNEIPAGA